MNKSFRLALAAAAFSAAVPALAAVPMTGDATTASITRQLNRYEQALNAADVERVMALYSDDGVFMPQHSPPSVGRAAVREAYQRVFGAIRLDIRFRIDEISQLSHDWAFARTRSTGTVKVLGSDQPPGPEANQELFLFHREADGQWRFARYIFTTTNPPRRPN
ncbi:SgcJ/EcaC family oxidoreductase [Jeongeupia sp. USM3]|uniref:YybH family protein n=1 Tax=Jeongeupia sp. USM3 TaxID=1906741 RepID=UPI00089DD69A|nr:SgcJ/EcaC family oxidoreductase [Jeongeupia sp. USM3]AOX99506.1 DUF4440 domain-containing protein [Jeongeupia sp. USM3]